MTHNMSAPDRLVRILLGTALLGLVFVGPKSLWGLVGLVPLATGVAGYCPLYGAFHVSTRAPHTQEP